MGRSEIVALRAAREEAIARLSDAFAHDIIDVDEFERRLTLAHAAASVAEVDRTIADLAAPAHSTALAPVPAPAAIAVATTPTPTVGQSIVAVFAGVERSGRWSAPRHFRATAVFGGMVLDLREVPLPPGVTEVEVRAVFGGVQVIVPPTLSVEVSGSAFLGGFAHVARVPHEADPDRPVLRVTGLAVLGGVAVETRLPGESETDMHRRRRRDRRALGGAHEPKRLPDRTRR